MNNHDFGGGNFRNAAMSRSAANRGFSSGRFGSSRNFEFGHNRFGRGGFGDGRFGGRGFGYGHFGYGHFGYGGFGYGGGWFSDPFSDFWFLGDLFGLALDIGRLAIMPAWGFLGADLLGTGLEALGNLGDNNYDTGSYGYYGDNSYNQRYYATRSQFLTAPCGNYYSDENPGCLQEY
jgi:hypothetical protein